SIATQGDTVIDMLRRLHGEGHPALWYLLLRGGSDLIGPAALPVLATGIGIAAGALLAFTSGIRWWALALVLFGLFFLYEYTIMARNYGLSMLILFGLALVVRRNPGSLWVGALLFLLVNVNVHSVLIAGAFLLFRLVETLHRTRDWKSPEMRRWLVQALAAAVGVACCIATVYPSYNDAAMLTGPAPTASSIAAAARSPGYMFRMMFPGYAETQLWLRFTTFLFFASTLGLVRSFGAWLAAVFALVAMSVFFGVVYQGGYRHDALWLALLLTMYWVAQDQRFQWTYPASITAITERLRPVGIGATILLFGLQLPPSIAPVRNAVAGIPESQSASVGRYLAAHPEYRRSWIISDTDSMIEALPYYAPNPIYMVREHRARRYAIFTRKTLIDLRLGTLVDTARALQAQSGAPTLILLTAKLTPTTNAVFKSGYVWLLTVTPSEATQFLAQTRLLGHFRPATSDEEFDLYSVN
ncbi:MAG: hypothetical protein ACRYG4_15155, partial [Janthinobacterium lividum]